ncbi:dystonin [Caerostris extrusa]|uniref:Dystonin n=1 Tax=Caerostris extrusa TaxID=172846 RepID=A0AAV4XXQ9_CAEEX|nr:dystonin [Caerostris extrusa]
MRKPIPHSIYMLGDIIDRDLIEISDYSILCKGERIPLLDALNHNHVVSDSIAKIENHCQLICLMKSAKESYNVNPLNKDIAISCGYYDEINNTFLDTKAKTPVTFQTLINQHANNFSQCLVKYPETLEYISLSDAISHSVIDENSGNYLNASNKTLVSCFEASQKLLLIYLPKEDVEEVDIATPITLRDVIERKIIDLDSLIVKVFSQKMNLNEAVCQKIIEESSILIYNPQIDALISFAESERMNMIDVRKSIYVHPVTGQELSWKDAFKRGFIVPKRKSISLQAAINLGWANSETGLILDPVTELEDNIELSLRKGVIHPRISLIKDTKSDRFLTLEEALQKRIVSKSGKIKNTSNGVWLNWDEALRDGLIETLELKLTLIQAIKRGLL